MKFRENSVQICLIVQLFITIVELHLVLRQPENHSLGFLPHSLENSYLLSRNVAVILQHNRDQVTNGTKSYAKALNR